MKIAIVSTTSFPITRWGTTTHTGDIVIVDLVRALDELGHEITFVAPEGSYIPKNGKLITTKANFGASSPLSEEIELDCLNKNTDILYQQDIVHDFSSGKIISQNLAANGKKTITTLMGGAWLKKYKPNNLIAWTQSHRMRLLKGHTDFYETPTPNLAGANGMSVENVAVVNGGIDTDFYSPTDYIKDDYYLFVGRWHEVRGYKMAIELAKKSGIKLIMSGEHPNNEKFEYQKNCALEAMDLAKNSPNIAFEWLPSENESHHIVKRNLFRRAKALILPTQFHEPFGLTMVEAMSCGTPVISTNYGSHPEIISHGLTGYVCNNNIHDMTQAISISDRLDPETCRNEMVHRFDKKIMAQSYLKQYQQIISCR